MPELIVTDAPEIAVLDFALAKRLAESLHKAYPGHLWAVTCEGDKGIATVRNLALSGRWGFTFLMSEIQDDPTDKKVIMAGGELLERYRVRRAKADRDELDGLPTDNLGRLIFDAA